MKTAKLRPCMRCGKPMQFLERTCYVRLHGEEGVQHEACAEFYRGTDVHYRIAPDTGLAQECYSHDWGGGDTHTFNITSLRWRAIKGKRQTVTVAIEHAQIMGLMVARSMDPADALAVRERRLRQGTWDDPGVLAHFRERGGSLIVDGNHRYVGKSFSGEDDMRFYVFDFAEVGRDVIAGLDMATIDAHAVTDRRWGL